MKIALTLPGYGQIDSGLPTGVPTGGLFDTGANIIKTLLVTAVIILAFTAVYFIIAAAISLIVSRGYKDRIKNNREAIMHATLGLFLIFFSFLLINVIGSAFGIDFISWIFK